MSRYPRSATNFSRTSIDGQGSKWRRKIAENFNRLSRAHERYRQTTDGQCISYSERELEFTFAKHVETINDLVLNQEAITGDGHSSVVCVPDYL